jgi:hypothetical protein
MRVDTGGIRSLALAATNLNSNASLAMTAVV